MLIVCMAIRVTWQGHFHRFQVQHLLLVFQSQFPVTNFDSVPDIERGLEASELLSSSARFSRVESGSLFIILTLQEACTQLESLTRLNLGVSACFAAAKILTSQQERRGLYSASGTSDLARSSAVISAFSNGSKTDYESCARFVVPHTLRIYPRHRPRLNRIFLHGKFSEMRARSSELEFHTSHLRNKISLACSYEATSSRKTRSLVQELTTGAVASVFLGFGSLFLLIACGVYV
ncbi:uncharacterized protein HKW66_Vig0023430 [Vigna angularis]|uniref:Dolichyl-diphosphooligosaccharide-protein glycosyltransferase subunit OST5 n=1 Tax=Phaseolus angularis TaxID=3914 RepID=A0A8T0L7L6_PHAAN|nr:uncharacterized protein HKW66_Vig0023430 [Vigna angularis]